MKAQYLINIILSCLLTSCSVSNDEASDDYRIYAFTEDLLVGHLFELALCGNSQDIDAIAKLNPRHFIPTDRTQSYQEIPSNIFFVKSTETGIVYEIKIQKGDKIKLPIIQY